ncbi:MAG: glutathione synthase [Betaproteobacteria bacterium]|nr:glutathione synthase [Betaproteobacteria bacterium]
MRIGIVLDPLDSLKIYKDSTYTMMVEAAARGHALWVMMQEGLLWKNGRVLGAMQALTLTGSTDDWYTVGDVVTRPLAELDCVLMRKDPPFDIEYVTSTWMLEHAKRQGARVFNDPRAMRDHSEKLSIMQFSQFCVPTIVTRLVDELNAFIDQHRETVVKPLDGMGGAGIFRVMADDPNRNIILETVTEFGQRMVMGQQYIPAISEGDKRILVIGGKPVPYSLARIPKAGEFRGNLATGGRGVARPLSERDKEIAAAIGPELANRGLLLVGLDVIGDHLTEVNVTSPTCFREIMDQTGFNVAGMLIDALERAVRADGR